MRTVLVSLAAIGFATLSGCLGGGESAAFVPGEGYEETGRTVHLKMWVVDLEQAELAPGLKANLWAFCAEAADPADEYSRKAIEYREQAGIVPDGSEGKCSVPGPTIRVNQGDKVVVDFTNTHVHPHTIHWHGQLVDWKSDGTPGINQDSVKPGDTFRYEFIAKKAGTLWYHCHVDTQFHVMQGLYGGFIVEPQDKDAEPESDKEFLLVMSTAKRSLVEYIPPKPGETVDPHAAHKAGGGCGVTGEQGCENPAVDVTPDIFLLNGKSAPLTEDDPLTLVKVREGNTVRLRVLNAGTTMETLHPHGHDVKVTHRDGSPLDSPFWVDTLTIGPAERYDMVFEATNPGVWIMHTHVNDHETNCGRSPGGMETMILYEGFENQVGTFKAELPATCDAKAPFQPPEDVRENRAVQLSSGPDNPAPSTSLEFRVEPCAVKRLQIKVEARAPDVALQALNDLRIQLAGPDGDEVRSAQLGSGTVLQWTEDYPGSKMKIPEGNLNLTISGRAMQTELDITVLVDYYASITELEAAGLSCAGH